MVGSAIQHRVWSSEANAKEAADKVLAFEKGKNLVVKPKKLKSDKNLLNNSSMPAKSSVTYDQVKIPKAVHQLICSEVPGYLTSNLCQHISVKFCKRTVII